MELNDVLLKRRSIRKYKKQVVKHEDIVTMIEYARLAPSWKNSQVTRYHVIESEDILHQVKNALAEFNQENVRMHLF